jgi:hypothetical protein
LFPRQRVKSDYRLVDTHNAPPRYKVGALGQDQAFHLDALVAFEPGLQAIAIDAQLAVWRNFTQ